MARLKSWEGGLFVIFLLTLAFNAAKVPEFLTVQNQINLFQLSIEKIIVALPMALIIINAEIDISVASVMGLSAAVFASLVAGGFPAPAAVLASLVMGLAVGSANAVLIARLGIPSLVVTLAMMIGLRGAATVLVRDQSLGDFPGWFDALGQKGLLDTLGIPAGPIGQIPLAIWLFLLFLILLGILLHRTGFGRQIVVIGTNAEVARFSGLDVARVKTVLFVMISTFAALAGLLYAARFGSIRNSLAQGDELDIITMVLLGGVSIFGGKGSMPGVILSILIILNLRNGMDLMSITKHIQTGVIGVLLIASVLVPNLFRDLQARAARA